MPRRPAHKLRALYFFRKSRPKSAADGLGVLYAFVDHGGTLWKVGHTNNFPRRQAEWDKQCPCPDRVWLPPVPVPQRRRAESLAHLLLEIVCQDRPRTYCAQYIMQLYVLVKPGTLRQVLNVTCLDIPTSATFRRSDISISTTFRCLDVSISTTSRRLDVPTSGMHNLGKVILNNLMFFVRLCYDYSKLLAAENINESRGTNQLSENYTNFSTSQNRSIFGKNLRIMDGFWRRQNALFPTSKTFSPLVTKWQMQSELSAKKQEYYKNFHSKNKLTVGMSEYA
ncbi:hypothetical protein GG344DRAFT_69627 [Lentinula edodes]|nr:hypothetical protein GG344DRAFT_69627 [Lentinula edodes]